MKTKKKSGGSTSSVNDAVLSEARRLYDLGAAVHWLFPKSKRPLESGWTTGDRQPWSELESSYRPGLNVGIRLGSASVINWAYLSVLDVDVKSTDARHQEEVKEALADLLGFAECPEVSSGRGNGSKHLYFLSPKAFKTWNPRSSVDTVKVFMPSKSASKKEQEVLSAKEIAEGWRLSKAWEISLYCHGRQVVVPPSIHPDSGKHYAWVRSWESEKDLPLLSFNAPEEKGGIRDEKRNQSPLTPVDDFVLSDVELSWLPMDEEVKRVIIEGGEGITDRSGYLLRATNALANAGLSQNEILTVLTEPQYFLGQTAYDHAQTKSRDRAAHWLLKYTVAKVMRERDPKTAFFNQAVVWPEDMNDESVAKQSEEIEEELDWRSGLETTKAGGIKNSFTNLKLILTNVCDVPGIVGRNEFAANDYYLVDTPWRSKKGAPLVDMDTVRVKSYCAEQFGVEFGDKTIEQTLLDIADVNRYHPVRGWLKDLKWDGRRRVDTWLKDYAGVKGPSEYVSAVSRKMLVAMVKRVMEPGCKFDHVVILEGLQGVGKSSLLRNLTGEWFTDQPMNIKDKDAILNMQNKWLIELGELSALNRTEVEAMKAFITQQVDRIRAPYGRKTEEYPRQCILVGSTNKEEYLKDETGNRRFWPVECGEIDFEGIAEARDELFAEAFQLYLKGEPLYLENQLLISQAQGEQEKRGEYDELTGVILDIVKGEVFPKNGFELCDLAKRLDLYGFHQMGKSEQIRLGKILKMAGFIRFQEGGGKRRKLWKIGKEAGTISNHTNHHKSDELVRNKTGQKAVSFL